MRSNTFAPSIKVSMAAAFALATYPPAPFVVAATAQQQAAAADTTEMQSQPLTEEELGSGLVDQSQKMTVAAMQMAEKKVWAQRS
jgi:hypothetical protein